MYRLLPALFLVACAHGTEHHGPHGSASGHHHGPAAHRFDNAEQWAKRFEDPARDAWQKPDEVLAALGLSEAMRVADIGSATGYFSVRIASLVPRGRVWGVDIEPDMVRYLNARARHEGHDNLFSILGTPSDPLLPEPVDLVIVVDTYHHIDNRPHYFASLKEHLSPEGRVVIVDFKKGELPVGPPDTAKISPEQVERELGEAGYAPNGRYDFLPYQYMLVFAPRGVSP